MSGGQRGSRRRPKWPTRARPALPLLWTDRALSDLEAIGDFIARDKPAAAERWVAKLVAVAERAATVPRAGRRVAELAREDVREVLLPNYRVKYRLTEDHIEVLTVFEGHRLFPPNVPEED